MSELREIVINNFGVVLLAAGNSTRLGRPKQLVRYNNQTLLQHNVQVAIGSDARDVVVVTGAYAESIKLEIENLNIHIFFNSHWQEGMASSIRCGLKMLIEINPSIEGVIVMVCDQPHTSIFLLNQLITTYQETKKEIVSSDYKNILGPPVFFHRSIFPDLLKLSGNLGAKHLISTYAHKVAVVPFPKGSIDIDTEEDYQKLLKGG